MTLLLVVKCFNHILASKNTFLTLIMLTIFLTFISYNSAFAGETTCSTGWYITGYFTPVESDYSGPKKIVTIEADEKKSFYRDFLKAIETEGWGKTIEGYYIGPYGDRGSWMRSNNALDTHEKALTISSIATDPSVIPHGKKITIPTLPPPWNDKVFIANDIGDGVKGKHIDVFTGEGKVAEQETFRITGYNNKVCIQ